MRVTIKMDGHDINSTEVRIEGVLIPCKQVHIHPIKVGDGSVLADLTVFVEDLEVINATLGDITSSE